MRAAVVMIMSMFASSHFKKLISCYDNVNVGVEPF